MQPRTTLLQFSFLNKPNQTQPTKLRVFEIPNNNQTITIISPIGSSLPSLRSLRISIPFSDSACSSSTESSDCESSTNYLSEAAVSVEPVEILPGLFLGNASHSEDLKSLKKYNIKVSKAVVNVPIPRVLILTVSTFFRQHPKQYILNVTPDLPNVFERDGQIRYLQIPITDHWSQAGDLANHFPDAIKFIGKLVPQSDPFFGNLHHIPY